MYRIKLRAHMTFRFGEIIYFSFSIYLMIKALNFGLFKYRLGLLGFCLILKILI